MMPTSYSVRPWLSTVYLVEYLSDPGARVEVCAPSSLFYNPSPKTPINLEYKVTIIRWKNVVETRYAHAVVQVEKG